MGASRFVALALCAVLLACSSATIERKGASNVEGMIVGGNRDFLYVLRDDDSVVKVRRAQVRDIDHPGNVLLVIGLPFVAMGLTYFMTGAAAGQNTTDREMFYGVGGFYGVLGAALAVPGYISWSSSRSAADPEDNLDVTPFGKVPEAGDEEGEDRSDAAHPPVAAPLPRAPTPAGLELRGEANP